LISSNEVAIAWGICHAVVITTGAIAIATEIAVSVFPLTIFFIFVVLVILIKRTKFFL
jgi:hypothetical protein